ncbi:cupin domain-containing protein [Microbaculum marinum]|uniref:Cupin domain-containing protein n=1 Tax=Microbaculum marinum TaxID=1764581 RepID=A0AAW9RU76_9HYPH
MAGELSAEEVIALLGLQPHHTCGFVAQTYVSPHMLPESALPDGFRGARSAGAVMYFMVTGDAHIVMHAIRSDQVYHHYLGRPLEVLLLYPDGRGEVRLMGGDLASGQRPQLFIPGGTVHMSRVSGGEGYALLGTSEWIGVDPADVVTPALEDLVGTYPAHSEEIRAFSRGTAPLARPLVRT